MIEINTQNQALKALLMGACVIIVVWGLREAEGLILPILLAFFIATASYPVTRLLRAIKIPKVLSVFLTVVIDCGFLIGLGLLVNMLLGNFQQTLQEKYIPMFDRQWVQTAEWIREHWGEDAAAMISGQINEFFNPDRIGAITKTLFSVGFGFVTSAFVVLILLIFMLTEAKMFGRRLTAIFEARGPDFQRMVSASQDIQRYLGIKTTISLITGALAWGLCELADIDFPILWGIIAFALNFIPAVGSILAGVPPILLALLINGWSSALVVMGGYIAINAVLGNFIEPMLLGRRFGLSTLVVILSVLFWGWLWGPLGMLMAVPLTMILKVSLDNSPELRWLSVAISKEKKTSVSQERLLEIVGQGKGETEPEAGENSMSEDKVQSAGSNAG